MAKNVGTVVGVDESRATDLQQSQGIKEFGRRLAQALEDGRISERERAELDTIASDLNRNFSSLVRDYFREEGEQFLRGIFAAMVEDGELTGKQWRTLLETAETLGLSKDEVTECIREQINQFVEHVLADAKTDGRLDEDERATLAWLVDNVMPKGTQRQYVQREIERLKQLTQIQDGQLPSIEPPADLAVKAGEIVHYHGSLRFLRIKELKSGPKEDLREGAATITDNRLIFDSPDGSFQIKHGKVISLVQHRHHYIHLSCSGKGQGMYEFEGDPELAFVVWWTAVAKANQTIVESGDDQPTRHIPSDVRQRVWQRYGGRCAECGDDQYLEFDHVIPVAKGGSNSDNNIQLLCRRCNLAKSDAV